MHLSDLPFDVIDHRLVGDVALLEFIEQRLLVMSLDHYVHLIAETTGLFPEIQLNQFKYMLGKNGWCPAHLHIVQVLIVKVVQLPLVGRKQPVHREVSATIIIG